MLVVGLAVAGALGAPVRYLLDGYVQERADRVLPLGTLVVNVSGSFLFGLVMGLALYHAFPATPRVILGAGFCGSYTTFSAFTYETVHLVGERALGAALQNALAGIVLPVLAAGAGLALMAA